MRRKNVILLRLAGFIVLGFYGAWQWSPLRGILFGPPARVDAMTVSGNIEAHESMLSFNQVQAPIVQLPFDEGAAVTAGTVLARVDDRLYRQQTEIDRTNVQIAAA